MSFEVTVTPTVYNVEVEVNPSVQPFDVQVITQQDLADLVDEAKQYAEDAEDSADSASASASSASASATTATNQANIATNQALLASAARLNAQNAANAAEDSADASALSAASALASATSAELDAIATASDRVQTGLDRQATGADRVQTGLDRVATGADRVQTGIDANTALTQAGVATTQAGIATTQAGIATTQAGNALTSANNALNSANAAAASAASASQTGTSTLLTGFATGSNTTILGTDTILQAFQKAQGQINARVSGTGVSGQVAFWSGTGTQSGDSGLVWNNTFKTLGVGTPALINIGINNAKTLTGGIFSASYQALGQIQSDVTNTAFGFYSGIGGSSTLNISNINHFTADQGTFVSGALVGIHTGFRVNNLSTGNDVRGISLGISSGANRWNLYASGTASNYLAGNLLLNTTTDAGFRLDVNGTARVQGNLTTNLTAGRVPFIGTGGVLSSDSALNWDNSTKILNIVKTGSSIGIGFSRTDLANTNPVYLAGDHVIGIRIFDSSLAELWRLTIDGSIRYSGSLTVTTQSSGNIVLNPDGSGTVSITDAKNIALGTTTGTKIGTATSQKLALWNATPIVQPTTSVAGATRVGGGGTTLTDTDTFDGYTVAQIVKALRNMGALA
jgi:hypothetical protein